MKKIENVDSERELKRAILWYRYYCLGLIVSISINASNIYSAVTGRVILTATKTGLWNWTILVSQLILFVLVLYWLRASKNNLNYLKGMRRTQDSNNMDKSTHYNSDRKVSCPAGSADWENALIEYESNSRDKGLWARLLAFHDGDENKAKAEYLSIKAMENASKRVIVPDKNGEGSVEADNEYLVWLFKNKKIEVFEGKTSIVRDRMWNWRDKSFDQRANLLSEIIKVRSIIYYREEVQVNVEGKSKIINSSQMDALLAYLERR